jgi:hypothetical protein
MVRTGRDICTARRILLAVATVTVSGSPVPSGTPDCLADYVPTEANIPILEAGRISK